MDNSRKPPTTISQSPDEHDSSYASAAPNDNIGETRKAAPQRRRAPKAAGANTSKHEGADDVDLAAEAEICGH